MLKNYFRIALRTLLRHRLFSIVNIFGLAVSMSACLMVISMLGDQRQYDQFHPLKKRIYRILSQRENQSMWTATSPYLLHEELLNSYTSAEDIVSLRSFVGGDIKYEDNIVTQTGLYASEDFFRMFSFSLKDGDVFSVLKDPYSMVLTEKMAVKLFGDQNPIGKTVSFVDRRMDVLGIGIESEENKLGDFKITGVIRDLNYKTHLHFDFLVSMNTLRSLVKAGTYQVPFDDWNNMWEFYTYVLVKENVKAGDLTANLNRITETKYPDDIKRKIRFEAQPLTSITPGKFTNNMISFSLPVEAYYFLSLLGLIVVFSACFNYTNLSLARAISRSKEVGLRKISGATRGQVFIQFISEAVVISLIALVFSVLLLQFLKWGFSGFWINGFLSMEFSSGIAVILTFIIFSTFIGIIAGLLPAAYLSSFNPLRILTKSGGEKSGKKGSFVFSRPMLGKTLVVAQFVFSMVLILSTITLFSQLRHLMVTKYGFDKDNIVNIKLQGNDYFQFSNSLSGNREIVRMSASNLIPSTGFSYGVQYKSFPAMTDSLDFSYFAVDRNYVDNLGLTMVAGRNFPENLSDKTEQYIIINETGAKRLGYKSPADAVGHFLVANESKEPVEIIGILKDFNYELFQDKFGPLVLRYMPSEFRYMNVKISGNDIPGTINFLSKKWKEADQVHPINYKFFDEQLAKTHAIFQDILSIVGFIALLAISISSLGLLGMATYTAETRKKEIGIRKAMGAEVKGLLILLSKGYLILLAVATLIALPLSYLINNAWLEEFAYRVKFGPGIILTGIISVFIIGLLTIGSQTLKAALTNPATILRDE
jgi:putative ABC transport system permease protein